PVRSRRERTGLFLFVVVGGCFSDSAQALGWETFLRLTHTDPGRLAAWSRRRLQARTAAALEAVQAGADGVVVADDLAHQTGTFADPRVLRRHFFPLLGEMVSRFRDRVPVFLHSDGCLDAILPDIVDMGFDGLHPLEPGAGMSPPRVGEATGWRLALMGGIDPITLATDDAGLVRGAVRAALPPRRQGRYLAGTAWGFPDDSVDPGRLLTLYRIIAEETGD
ncbi:MAG: uroporphyrinogen decarboxylase family protein, partial [bacterium]|nr:uroporphyrinogen decarboxylase family protein [bacterium]